MIRENQKIFMMGLVAVLLLVGILWYFFRTSKALPVLMFHKIDPERQDSLTVSVQQFEQRLQWLTDHHYQTITLEQLVALVEQHQPLPPRPVLITFDDA